MPQAIVAFVAPSIVGTFAGSVATAAVGLAITAGASYAVNALFGPDTPKGPRPQDVKGTVRQSVGARMRHYGRVRAGGSLVFIETRSGDLYQVIQFGQGPIDAFETWYVDDRVCAFNSEGRATTYPHAGLKGTSLDLFSRTGTTTQTAYSNLVSNFPEIWTSAHRGLGMASAELHAESVPQEVFNTKYPNRIPGLNVVMRACKVLDPRNDAAAAWSSNLPLILRDYMTHADGMQIDAAYVDDEDFGQAADDADENVPKKGGGTVKRYHGALSYALDSEPKSVLDRLLQATDGRLYLKPSGKIGFQVGKWVEPTVSIPDSALTSYQLQDGSGPLREANEVIVKWTNPAAKYSEATSDPWRDESDISLVGQVKSLSPEAYEIQNHNHARRIAKLIAARANPRWQGTIVTNLYGMKAWDQRFIRLEVKDLEIDFETFEVLSIALDDETMTVSMRVASFDASAYRFDAETEEGTAPGAVAEIEEDTLEVPQNIVVMATQRDVAGGTSVALIGAAWDPPERNDLTAQAQYSFHGADSWQEMSVTQDENKAEIVGLSDGAFYDLRFRFRGPGGAGGDWVTVSNILASADPIPPAAPSSVSAELGDDTETAKIRWTNPNSPNFSAAKVYRSTTSNVVDATLFATRYGAPLISETFTTDEMSSDTYWFWVAAANGSGVESAKVSAGSVTIS